MERKATLAWQAWWRKFRGGTKRSSGGYNTTWRRWNRTGWDWRKGRSYRTVCTTRYGKSNTVRTRHGVENSSGKERPYGERSSQYRQTKTPFPRTCEKKSVGAMTPLQRNAFAEPIVPILEARSCLFEICPLSLVISFISQARDNVVSCGSICWKINYETCKMEVRRTKKYMFFQKSSNRLTAIAIVIG